MSRRSGDDFERRFTILAFRQKIVNIGCLELGTRAMQFTGLVMQPHEIAAVKDIFDEITREPWFDKADGNEGALAAFMLRTYREGVMDPERLWTYCREVARFRWGIPDMDQG